uniref:Uncharacterized protein n=1 Tax=Anguilla anguilla TaxID=7936 RepID=A0A0E9XB29_ANGAN
MHSCFALPTTSLQRSAQKVPTQLSLWCSAFHSL